MASDNIELLPQRGIQGVDIIVFPEYGLTGTGLSDLPFSKFQEYCQVIHEPDYSKEKTEMVSEIS